MESWEEWQLVKPDVSTNFTKPDWMLITVILYPVRDTGPIWPKIFHIQETYFIDTMYVNCLLLPTWTLLILKFSVRGTADFWPKISHILETYCFYKSLQKSQSSLLAVLYVLKLSCTLVTITTCTKDLSRAFIYFYFFSNPYNITIYTWRIITWKDIIWKASHYIIIIIIWSFMNWTKCVGSKIRCCSCDG